MSPMARETFRWDRRPRMAIVSSSSAEGSTTRPQGIMKVGLRCVLIGLVLAAMVSWSSAEVLKTRPRDIKKLSGAVWELQKPQGPPEMDVIFFHGLQLLQADLNEADWRTWRSRDGTTVWPKDWLGAQFPGARIWSISYIGIAHRLSNGMRVKQITENLLHDIVMKNYGAGKNRPVIFVGHSLGGIIIKRFLLGCNRENSLTKSERIAEFLENCKGVFFYSTPFGGSGLGDWLNLVPFNNAPVVKLLTVFSSKTADINHDFWMFKKEKGLIKSCHVLENKKTEYKGISKLVVEEGSARRDDDKFYTVHADHIEVCKPENPHTDNIYTLLVDFIHEDVMGGKGNFTEKVQIPVAVVDVKYDSKPRKKYYLLQGILGILEYCKRVYELWKRTVQH